MTDVNAAAFSPSKPTIVEIMIEAATTDQPEADMLRRIAEHHLDATRADIKAKKDIVQNTLAWRQEGDKPTVPADWVVDRILNQALDAVVRRSTERPAARAVLEAAAGSIAQHPAQQSIILSLAMQQLESILDEVADERGISLSYSAISWPAVVEATEEEWKAVASED
jgi:hypothetical protein